MDSEESLSYSSFHRSLHLKTSFLLFTPPTSPWTPSLLTPDSESSSVPFTLHSSLDCRAGVWVSSAHRNWGPGDHYSVVGIRERTLAASGFVSLAKGCIEDGTEQVKFLFGVGGLQPYEELLAGFSYLTRSHSPYIPLLILQFQAHYSLLDTQCRDANAVYQAIDSILSMGISEGIVKDVLGLIGALEFPISLPGHKLHNTYSILATAKRHTIGESIGEKGLYSLRVRGLALVMALDCFNQGNEWKDVLAAYSTSSDLLLALAERPEMQDSAAYFIWDSCSHISQSLQIAAVKIAVRLTYHFPTLLTALLELSNLLGDRTAWEVDFCTNLDLILSRNTLTIDDFRLLMRRSKELKSADSRLLQKTVLIPKLMSFPYDQLTAADFSQVLDCSTVYPLDRRCDLFRLFVLKHDYPIAAGVRILSSESPEGVANVWKMWVQSLASSPVSQQIQAADASLSDIADLDISKSLADLVIAHLFCIAANKEVFLQHSDLVAECKALKGSYIMRWRAELAKAKPEFLLYALTFAIKRFHASNAVPFFGDLCKAAAERLPDLTDDEVCLSLYQSNWTGPWDLLLRYRLHFEKNSAYVRRVISGVTAVASEILRKGCRLERLMLVKALDVQGRRQLVQLLEQTVAVKSSLVEALSSSLDVLYQLEVTMDQLEELLVKLLLPLPWASGLSGLVEAFKVKAYSSTVQAFSLPVDIAGLKAIAIQLKPFFASRLYQHFLQLVVPSSEHLEDEPAFVAVKACNSASERLSSALGSLQKAGLKGKLNDLLSLFEPVGLDQAQIAAEIGVLETGAPWGGYESWKEALMLISSQNQLFSHCKLLEGLSKLGLFSDSAVRKTCRSYIQLLNEACSVEASLEDFETVTSSSDYYRLPCTSPIFHDMEIGNYNRVSRDTRKSLYIDANAHTCLAVLEELYRSRELLAFLDTVTDTILTHLKESVNDYDDTSVTADIINDLEVAWGVREGLTASRGSYQALLSCVAQLACNQDEVQLKALYQSVRSCQEHVNDLSWLLREVENKGDARMSQIECIYQDSEVEFCRSEDRYEICLKYAIGTLIIIDVAHASKTIAAADLAELEDRATLTLHHSGSTLLQAFLGLSRSIRLIQARLTSLLLLGYPIDEARSRHFYIRAGTCSELSAFEAGLITIQKEYKAGLVRLYETYHVMTFFYGRQFWTLEEFLRGAEERGQEAEALLRYAQISPSQDAFSFLETPFSPLSRLESLAKALTSRSLAQSTRCGPLFTAPPSISSSACFLSVQCECPLSGLATVCILGGYQLPQAHQLLLGGRETMWEEVLAFLYRCIGDTRKGLYVLLGTNKLTMKVQLKMKRRLMQLTEEKVSSFHLAFISDQSESILSDYLHSCKWPETVLIPCSQVLTDPAVLTDLISQCDPHFFLVRSDIPGCGKSTHIKEQAKELARDLSYISLAGDLSGAGLCRALGTAQQGGLHLRLGLVEDVELVSDFLMSLSLARTWVHRDCRAFLPLAVVYLEIANLQPCIIEKVPFLRFLPCTSIQFKPKDAHIQSGALFYACKYLDLLSSNTIDLLELADSGPPTKPHSLLDRYYFQRTSEAGQTVSYRSLNAFAEVFVTLASHMETGPFALPMLQLAVKEAKAKRDSKLERSLAGLRTEAIQCALQTAIEATSTSISRVHREQLEALGLVLPNLYRRPDFAQQKHFAALFVEDGSLVPIYCSVSEVPPAFLSLFATQAYLPSKFQWKSRVPIKPDLPNYRSMSDADLKALLFSVFPHTPDPASDAANEELRLERVYTAQFVMTADTHYKMMMVYLRAMALQPVVIMGETGCGKTFLVRYFVRIVLKARLLLYSLHAGISNSDLDVIMAEIRQEAGRTQGLLWVFLDEFNTTLCMGRIADMLCERRDGETDMPRNVRFVVACNPLRRPGEAYSSTTGLSREASAQSKFTYMVKPLPENIMEYVWDFGSLSEEDSRAYICAMLQSEASLVPFTELVFEAHQYFKQSKDWVSASLRDVARFTKLYRWFRQTLPMRISNPPLRTRPLPLPLPLDQAAGILAFCTCYYQRFHSYTDRSTFLSLFTRSSHFRHSSVQQCIDWDQQDLLDRMELPGDTAANSALKENVTTLFHCVYNQIPVFLCGKPGCSKSLSIRMLFKACRGAKSRDLFFQKQQELVPRHFQGSPSCTSQGIKEVFQRAEKYLSTPNLLPVVVFDEIALAEQSHENPLKALHSLLEVESVKVGFVALSNWRLDAAKMNRVLYLARPDPSQSDLEATAGCLASALLGARVPEWCGKLLKALACAYFTCYQQWSREGRSVYGLRDFYGLVKQVAGGIRQKGYEITQESLFESLFSAIERNFGGDKEGKPLFLASFESAYPIGSVKIRYCRPIPIPVLISANISDPSSRYLLLIGRNDVNSLILQRASQSCHFLIGSSLPGDQQSDEYIQRSLTEVLLYMEKPVCLVLAHMDQSYGALYDLFNQSFDYSTHLERKYCRVALGPRLNPRCVVNAGFRVVVMMQEEQVRAAQAPFLNRFEKQIVEVADLLDETHREVLAGLNQWLTALFTLANGRKVELPIASVLPFYVPDQYLSLLAYTSPSLEAAKAAVIETASDDILPISVISQLPEADKWKLRQMWEKSHSLSLAQLLAGQAGDRVLVFTQSREEVSGESVEKGNLEALRSDQEVLEEIRRFGLGGKRAYVMEVSLTEGAKHLCWLQHVLSKAQRDFPTSKVVLVLARYARSTPPKCPVSLCTGWSLRHLDHFTTVSPLYLDLSNEDLRQRALADFPAKLGALTREAYEAILFTSEALPNEEITGHIRGMVETLPRLERLLPVLKVKVAAVLQDAHFCDWREAVLCDSPKELNCPDLATAIEQVQAQRLRQAFTWLVIALERRRAAECLCTDLGDVLEVWIQALGNLELQSVQPVATSSVTVAFKARLRTPFILNDWEALKSAYRNLKAQDKPGFYQFSALFRSSSILPLPLQSSPSASQIYLTDLIQLLSEDQSIEDKYLGLVRSLDLVLVQGQEELWERVWTVMGAAKMVEMIVGVVRIWESMGRGELVGRLEEAVAGEGEKGAMERIAEAVEGLSLDIVTPDALGSALASSTPSSFFNLLRLLFDKLKALANSSPLELTKLANLDFWMRLLPVASQLGTTGTALSLLITQGKELDTAELPYVYNDSFTSVLIRLMENSAKRDVQVIADFKLNYFAILLNGDLRYVQKIAACLKEKFTPCPAIIEKIVRITDLTPISTFLVALSQGEDPFSQFPSALEPALFPPFATLLSDALLNSLAFRPESGSAYLAVYSDEFNFASTNFKVSSDFPRLRELVLIAAIRYYADNYCRALLQDDTTEDQTRALSFAMGSPDYGAALRLYCLKTLRRLQSGSFEQFRIQTESRLDLDWTRDCDFKAGKSTTVPLLPLIKDAYSAVSMQLKRAVKYHLTIDNFTSPTERLAFLVAFWLEAKGDDVFTLERWLNQCKHSIQPKALHLVASLASSRRLLALVDGKAQQAECLYLFLSLIVAYSAVENPLSRLLFDGNGDLWPNIIEHCTGLFKYGAESSPQYDYLRPLLHQLEGLKVPPESLVVVKCPRSPNCPYLSLRPQSPAQCPLCSSALSTQASLLTTREQAIAAVQRTIKQCTDTEASTYTVHGKTVGRGKLPAREMRTEVAFRVLHLWLNVSLALGLVSGLVSEVEMRRMVCFTTGGEDLMGYFRATLRADFEVMEERLGERVYCYLESLLCSLPQFLQSGPYSCATRQGRVDFERDFERTCVLPFSAQGLEQYRQKCQWVSADWESLIEEMGAKPDWPNLSLFRCRVMGDFEGLRDIPEDCPGLRLFVRRKKDFDRLKCLYPLLALTKALLQRFNHRISRHEAENLSLSDALVGEKELFALFQKVRKRWNSQLKGVEMEWEGEVLYGRELKKEDSIGSFLPDLKGIEGKSVPAAFRYLCSLQNSLLFEANVDSQAVSLEHVSKEHVILLNVDEKRHFGSFWSNDPEYGRGEKALYAWKALEEKIWSRLSDAWRLTPNLLLVQYQFELFCGEKPSLFCTIAENIPQTELSEVLLREVQSSFPRKAKGEQELLSQAFGALCSLLAHVAYMRSAPSAPLSSLARGVPDFQQLSAPLSSLLHFPLGNVLALYCCLEDRYFEYAKLLLPGALRAAVPAKELQLVVDIRNHVATDLPPLNDVKKALRRLIMRCLLSGTETNPSLPALIVRPDLWLPRVLSVTERKKLKDSIGSFPVKTCYCLYESLAQADSPVPQSKVKLTPKPAKPIKHYE